MKPRPHSPHSLEVPKKAMRLRGRHKRRNERRADEHHECPEDRLVTEIKLPRFETERPNQDGGPELDDNPEEKVPRDDVREKESRQDDHRNEQRRNQQYYDRRAPGNIRPKSLENAHGLTGARTG